MLEPIYGSSIGGYISMTALVIGAILFVLISTLFILDISGEIDIGYIPFIMVTACIGLLIFVAAFGICKINNDGNANVEAAIESDYPDAVITDMIVENKTSYGTFQANEAEYCYKVENNQLRIQRRNLKN